jgi:hypothetical protein
MGGGALLLWLLWRSRGNGKRGQGSGGGGDVGRGDIINAVSIVIMSGDRLTLDGVPTDLSTAIARARAADATYVHVVGDARHGWVCDVLEALKVARVNTIEDSSVQHLG